MSKIIYRKVRTAPGQKQYLDANKTQVNPAFEQNAAYYVKAVSTETLSLRDMSKHISSHGSPYTAAVVMGVLEAFRSCLLEQLLESKKVKIEGLGTFYVTIANRRGGEKELAKFNIGNMAVGLRLRFLPETAAEEKISQKEFLKKAKFIDVADLANIDENPSSEDDNGVVIDDGNGGENQNQNGGGTNTGDNNGETPSSVAAPTISGASPFALQTEVTLSAASGAAIHYTTDGSVPTSESQTYSAPFMLSSTTVVKAIAIKNGVSSDVASKTFTKSSSNDD
jgi:predicted histone-like DNA-binding protein